MFMNMKVIVIDIQRILSLIINMMIALEKKIKIVVIATIALKIKTRNEIVDTTTSASSKTLDQSTIFFSISLKIELSSKNDAFI